LGEIGQASAHACIFTSASLAGGEFLGGEKRIRRVCITQEVCLAFNCLFKLCVESGVSSDLRPHSAGASPNKARVGNTNHQFGQAKAKGNPVFAFARVTGLKPAVERTVLSRVLHSTHSHITHHACVLPTSNCIHGAAYTSSIWARASAITQSIIQQRVRQRHIL
jgi:hypothetical protein